MTNLEYKCIECIHLDSIDFHLDIPSLLLDQNSYLFDDNLENSILDDLRTLFYFLKSYLGRPDSIRPFSAPGSCSFSILYKRFPYHFNYWVEIPSSGLKIQDSPLDIWTFVFEKAWFWFACDSSIDANACHTLIHCPWVSRIRHYSFFGKTTLFSFGNMFDIGTTWTAWSWNTDRCLTGQWRTDVIWAHDKWCHTATDGALVIQTALWCPYFSEY